MKVITSRDNPFVKRLRLLATSTRERRKAGATLLDGVHLVEAALAAGFPVHGLIVSEQGMANAEIASILAQHAELPATHLTDAVFATISPVDTPSGLLAMMSLPETLPPPDFRTSTVVLDGVQEPGNLGAIVRTAAAAGIGDVVLTMGCTQAWSPRALRAGMGGHFGVRIHERVDAVALLADFDGPVLATGLGETAQSLYLMSLAQPVVWLFGAEGAGLSTELAARATATVRIPMSEAVESLNVGAAAAVCLFEQRRQMEAW
ncbi:MAG TPA: RNA methyltransferase [Azoarcus sp.]|nr:RNA methyltransferase [Azoarcus sp.]